MKKFMKKLLKKAEGFTLVELIVVIAILGILAAVAVPAYSGYLTKANEAADMVQLDAVKTAVQAAYAKEDDMPTSIKVTEGGNSDTIVVDPAMTTEQNNDFLLYYGGSSFSIDLESCKTATWNGTTWTLSNS